tara:strand:- start:2587 stop:3222 length:636 start_codon:yes stop_codon:yes gene_type:complete
MDLVKVTDGTPQRYSLEQFKRDNPRTGFPDPLSAGDLTPYGVFFLRSDKPKHNAATQVISDTGIALEGGSWVVQWAVSDLYPDAQSARAAMLGFIERLTDQVTSQYPKAEVAAWPSKAEAARAVIADTARADQVALIQDEADIAGATVADQVTAIVKKAVVFEAIVAKVSGLRQKTDKALVAATTSAEREAVLDAATIQAADLATAYGLTV